MSLFISDAVAAAATITGKSLLSWCYAGCILGLISISYPCATQQKVRKSPKKLMDSISKGDEVLTPWPGRPRYK